MGEVILLKDRLTEPAAALAKDFGVEFYIDEAGWPKVRFLDGGPNDVVELQRRADVLRRAAWLMDGMASDCGSDTREPIAVITFFAGGRIDLIADPDEVGEPYIVEWLRVQFEAALGEL